MVILRTAGEATSERSGAHDALPSGRRQLPNAPKSNIGSIFRAWMIEAEPVGDPGAQVTGGYSKRSGLRHQPGGSSTGWRGGRPAARWRTISARAVGFGSGP